MDGLLGHPEGYLWWEAAAMVLIVAVFIMLVWRGFIRDGWDK